MGGSKENGSTTLISNWQAIASEYIPSSQHKETGKKTVIWAIIVICEIHTWIFISPFNILKIYECKWNTCFQTRVTDHLISVLHQIFPACRIGVLFLSDDINNYIIRSYAMDHLHMGFASSVWMAMMVTRILR